MRRLYYYAEDTRDPAQSEVDFWVQALKEGDVSPVTLGQTFLFSPERINSYTDGEDFLSRASLSLLGEDLVQTGNANLAEDFAKGGALEVYKIVYSLPSCQQRFAGLGLEPGVMDDRMPLDRDTLAAEVQAARDTRATQSVTDEADRVTYTPGYILTHLPDTALLLVRSAVENGDHYLRTLVGGSLSYYSLDLAWGWVVVLYMLLIYAALPVQGAALLPAGRGRVWCAAAAVLCCLLAVGGMSSLDAHPLRYPLRPAGAVFPARAAAGAAHLSAPRRGPCGRRGHRRSPSAGRPGADPVRRADEYHAGRHRKITARILL